MTGNNLPLVTILLSGGRSMGGSTAACYRLLLGLLPTFEWVEVGGRLLSTGDLHRRFPNSVRPSLIARILHR